MLKVFDATPINVCECYDLQVSDDALRRKNQLAVIAVVDQFDSQSFNINDSGWIRNDISQLARAQSQAEYDMILARLREMPASKGIPEDVKLEDAIMMVKPRYAQSPSELSQYAEYVAQLDMKRLDEAYAKSLEDKPVEISVDNPVESKSD